MDNRAVALTILLIFVSLGTIYWISSWEIPLQNGNSNTGEPEWVLMQPQTCSEIPWRKEWSLANQKNYSDFPIQDELTHLTTYYTARGITVLDASFTYQPNTTTCTGCGCPEPFVFALYVSQTDAARLSFSGFTILDTTDPYIFTGPLFRQSTTQPISTVSASDCEDVFFTDSVLDKILGNKKDSCYIQAAISSRDVSLCENVSAAEAKNTCYIELAVAKKDIQICARVTSEGARTSCLTNVAGILQQPALCASISDAAAKAWCELGATPK